MAKKLTRTPVPERTLENVLVKSRRRCCLCYGLNGYDEPVEGQIAHIDRDSGDNSEDNLAFLCLNHHSQYDAVGSRTKTFMPAEVRRYRDLLYQSTATTRPEVPSAWKTFDEFENLVLQSLRRELQTSLHLDIPISHRQRLNGRSGNSHEVDMSFEISIGGMSLLIIVEAKHHNRPVALNEILAFAAIVDDLGASKGVFVSSGGFQASAKRLAKSRGIVLARLVGAAKDGGLEWLAGDLDVAKANQGSSTAGAVDIDRLKSILRRSSRSFAYLRDKSGFDLTDLEFENVICEHSDVFAATRIIDRDKAGKRITPGRKGIKLKKQRT